jgi:hypothetical protein
MLSLLNSIFFGENSDTEMKKFDIEHIAIDQSSNLGSLYDECQDTIKGKLDMDLKSQRINLNEPITCRLHKGLTPETKNLLEIVDIDHSLRANIILKIIQPTGIASIIDYPQPIDQYTRFLYFYQTTLHESCYDDLIKEIKYHKLPISEISATHIITEIFWGIHVVVILQLPPDQEAEIDHLLEKIRHSLINNEWNIEMIRKEKSLFDQIISTTVYSNISDLTKLTRLDDIFQRILRMRNNIHEHHRVKYILSPIQLYYPDYNGNYIAGSQDYRQQIQELENYFFRQFSELKVLHLRLDYELPELLQGKFQARLIAAKESLIEIKKLYENNMQQIRDLVVRLRKKQNVLDSIDEVLNSDVQATMKHYIQSLIISLDNLTSKGNLIKRLQNDDFEYYNVVKLGIDQECNEQLVKDILFKNNLEKIIFCSTDILRHQSPEEWDTLYSKIKNDRQKNPQWSLVYADFTYSTWCLKKMVILSSNERTILNCQSTTEATSCQEKRKASLPSSKSNDEFINILLIGESGVGKSTFINSFANYLQFNSLEQAQSGHPIVVIPVSFLMTVNDDFNEQLIKFGEPDLNENQTNSGQSATQQCRSYVFQISSDKKLRIIDTPGFGDTRGENQDEINMEMIFSFINNLTHLNGICLLFKPNVGQLNPFLYSRFTQLFQFFGENIRDHFIFCFTNARSTFFTPGDTRPLLRSLFDSFSVKKIPFEKKNTFCFDSESFRYLIALQRSLTFKEIEKDEFEKSWTRSVEESKRLQNFLCEKLQPYRKNIEWQSIQQAQFQIKLIIRPMLEAIRNILRNILLYQTNCSIKLIASCVDRPTMICYTFDRTLERFGEFWILSDDLRPLPNMVCTEHFTHDMNIYSISIYFQCTSNEQIPTEYRLGYEFLRDQTNESIDILDKQRNFLYETCTKFARFLIRTQTRQDNPFLLGLVRMIQEEQFICQRHNQKTFNQQLAHELKVFKNEYERLLNETYSGKETEMLSNIYELIMLVNKIPMVKKQIDAIKTYQELFLTSNERNINGQLTKF